LKALKNRLAGNRQMQQHFFAFEIGFVWVCIGFELGLFFWGLKAVSFS